MKEIDIKKRAEEIRAFFNRESMYRVMRGTLSFLLKGRPIEFYLNIGGPSYTDSKKLVVGLPEQLFTATYEEIYIAILALLGHEAQHVLSSNFKAFKKYNKEETQRLVDEGMPYDFASHFVHAVGNIIEDGRIEMILANRLPGYIPKLQFLNMYFWKLNEIAEETKEIQVLILTMLSLATLGIYPKGYNKFFSGTRLDDEIDKIKPLIDAGIKARTCNDGLNICRKIIETIKPYLFELYEEVREEEETMEQLMELLNNLMDDDFNNSEETEFNEDQTHSPHIQMPNENQEENEEDNKEGNKGQDKGQSKKASSNEGKNEEKAENREGSGGDSGKEEHNKNRENESNTSNSSNGNSGSKTDKDNGKEKSNIKEAGKESEDSGENTEEINSKNKKQNSSENGNESKRDNDTESTELSGGVGTAKVEVDKLTEEFISEKIQEITNELFEEARENFKQAAMEEKNNPKIKDGPALTEEEKQKLQEKYGITFNEYPNDFPLTHDLPLEIKIPANKFRRDIEKIFKNKTRLDIHGQYKGVLNTEDLYRIGLGEYNVFTMESSKNTSNYAVYILQDGSGSMSGEKEVSSAYALSIIEEGLRDIVPLKIVTFATWDGVDHFVVRNWDDKSKKNYAYNFLHYRSAMGANEDGYSIRVATKELLKRAETDKVLIVLSDGLPPSIEDTKEAIKEARQKRIHVVGIMFGSEEFRKKHFSQYKAMYEKNIIAINPKSIPDMLTMVLKKILAR